MLTSESIYAPLSQNISDSESEEEKFTSKNFHQRLRSTIQKNHNYIGNNNNNNNKYHQTNNNNNNNNNNYHQNQQHNIILPNSNYSQNSSRMNSLVSSDSNNFQTNFTECSEDIINTTDADNVAILGQNGNKEFSSLPMSPMRKLCFIASILFCILIIILFLWVIPCNEESTCPAPLDRIKTHNWLNQYNKFELKGMVNVVHGTRNWEKNLIFMYRADNFFPEFDKNNHKRNGIISLIGNSGKISWYNEMENEPIAVDCQLIDINKNGKTDCLVIDEFGELGAFDPIWGLWLWKFKDNSTHRIDLLDFPAILPDVNGDNINDLLMATANNNYRNLLRIISGKNGQPIGLGYEVTECNFIRKFQFETKLIISFICINSNGTEIQKKKTLNELYALITNKQIEYGIKTDIEKIPQHKVYGQRKETLNQQNLYTVGNKKLIIENKGKCPEDCNMTITWSETINNRDKILGGINETKMYGMVPAAYQFKSKDGKPALSGFVLKIWEWNDQNDENYTNRQPRHTSSSSSSQLPKPDEFNTFDNLIKKRSTFSLNENLNIRSERSIGNETKSTIINNNLLLNYKMRIIKQKVLLIIFNSAPRIENTSQSNIIQFCRKIENSTIEECQPDLNYQENSLMISDLDNDGSQELVSYYTTFVSDETETENQQWTLKTYVQLLRLESELPILFEDIKNN